MNVFHKVTRESLKKNKTRTIVTIIGIILSAAMICGVTTFASSIYHYALDSTIYSEGSWHGWLQNTDAQMLEKMGQDDQVKTAAYTRPLGYSRLEEIQNKDKPYLYVQAMGAGAQEMLPIHLISGRMPETSSEILLPEHLKSNGGVKLDLGDTLELQLGDRMSDGYALNQNNPYYAYDESTGETIPTGETLQVRETREYQVVGFYSRFSYSLENYSSPGYTALTVDDGKDGPVDVFFQLKTPKQMDTFLSNLGSTGALDDIACQINYDVLMFSGQFRYDGFARVLVSMTTIVLGLIIFGSVALIYNAFSISVSERTKQFGLLSSVGATKKQVGGMVRYEAMLVSLIGVPIGVLCGIGGIGVTLYFIGDKFRAMGFPIAMKLHVSLLSVIAAVIVTLVTVLISAWIPSKRARRVTAVEAIRQNVDVKAKAKDVKTSKLTYKLFGLPGVLASKHYKRSRRKYRATILSLFMSIVLFVSASSFTDYLTGSVVSVMERERYDLQMYLNFGENTEDSVEIEPQQLLEKILGAKSVTGGAYNAGLSMNILVPAKQLNPQIFTSQYLNEDYNGGETVNIHGSIQFVDNASFRELLKQQKLNPDKYMDPEQPVALAVDGRMAFNPMEEVYENVTFLKSGGGSYTLYTPKNMEGYTCSGEYQNEAGETIVRYYKDDGAEGWVELSPEEAYLKKDFSIGDVIYEAPYFVDGMTGLTLLYPMDALGVFDEFLDKEGHYMDYMITSSNHAESYQDVKRVLEECNVENANLIDRAEMQENDRNLVTIIRVFSYGFIVLISLIAAANVFNTISTNIALRRREFAMLRSVGMTQKGFRRMMNYECLLYGAKALLFGLPVSCFVTYLIWNSLRSGIRASFILPWKAIGIATLSVFLVVFATMIYAMNKVKKDNLIEALKNENA